ncbi:MAG: hypothetical protein ACE5WD_10330 [Candidatus Aminicenantia bacterium]
MEKIISKEIAKKLMKSKGELRGAVFETDISFILREKGKEGLKKVEEEMKRLGYPFRYKNIRTIEFYPIGLRAVSLLAIKKVLGFSDEKIKEMGAEVPRFSSVIRFAMKFFSKEKKLFFENASELWKRFLTTGEFKSVLDEKNRMAISTLKNFNIHPIFCTYLLGIIPAFHKLITGAKEITCKETKCSFRGDEFHEFLVKHKY